jgi:RNA polymerase sigma-70 factor (ECF subfamily)
MPNDSLLNTEAWVDEDGDMLYRFASYLLKDHDLAEEIVQETFLAALKSKDAFKGQSSEKTWLFSILKHKIVDHIRRKKFKELNMDPEDLGKTIDAFLNEKERWQVFPVHWNPNPNPNEAQEFKELLNVFYKCLAELPERHRKVFVYRELDGLSTKEICNMLGVTTTNLSVMLYRARMLLRRCIELNWI